jgi:hypothetical protein
MPKKTTKKEASECCDDQVPIMAMLFVIIGGVWIAEHYARIDFPLTAAVLVLLGLYYLINKKV